MKMKKKTQVIFLITILFLLSGCGAKNAVVQEPEVHLTLKVPTLSLVTPADPDISNTAEFLEKAARDYMEKNKNVSIDLVVFPLTDEDAYITDCFDTENAADILCEGYFNMNGYVHTGRVVPLDDIITDQMREDISEAMWSISQMGKKTYMMPFTSTQNILVYNREWFRQAGLNSYLRDDSTIQSWTLEEWETILDTLASSRQESSFPMMMYGKNEQGDTHIMTLLRSHGSDFFDKDGNFNLNTPEGIAGLAWLAEGKEKGWFPVHAENLELLDSLKLFSNGQLGIYIANNATLNFEGIDVGYVNFPSADGKGYATSFAIGFEIFDNGDEAKIAAAKDFLSYIYETEQWLDYSAGGIPASYKTMEKYKNDIFMLEEFYANSANVVDFTRNNPNWRGVRSVFWKHIHDLLAGKLTPEEAAQKIDTECNSQIEEGRKNSRLHK